MKTWIKCIAAFFATSILIDTSFAQTAKEKANNDKKEKSQEIVIRKNGGKTEKMTIVVDGDEVTINGKLVDEYKNKDVRVFKRDGDLAMAPRMRRFSAPGRSFDMENFNYFGPSGPNKAMLGVLTSKAEEGVKVTDVTKESGAEKAGLLKDDVITKVDGKEVKEPGDLIEAIGERKPNDKVEITYKRDGKENKTTATLGENKPRAFTYNNKLFNFDGPDMVVPPMDNFNFNFNRRPRIGLQIQDVEEGKGVTVKDVDDDSPASKAGIKDGDVITQVNGKDVSGVDDLREVMKNLKEGETVKFSYKRDGKTQTAEVKIPKRLKSADL